MTVPGVLVTCRLLFFLLTITPGFLMPQILSLLVIAITPFGRLNKAHNF
jgi:hypothetical protein